MTDVRVLEVDEEVVDVVVEDKEVDGIEVAVEDNEAEAEGCKTVPLAPTYSYMESLPFPPQISAELPAQVKAHPELPSGAGPPPLEKTLPQWHSSAYSTPAY
jgi:hypothetical protein